MRVILLAGGYGTRLEQGFRADVSGRFAHLVGVPKPLVPVGGRPLLDHWVRAVAPVRDIAGTVLVTNAVHQAKYAAWAEGVRGEVDVKVVSDGTRTNEGRLGAVADIQLAAEACGVDDDFIVVGGDTLFYEDFSLSDVIRRFRALPTGASLVLCYECQDPRKHGILVVDPCSEPPNRVTDFVEKPTPEQTASRLACPCFYVLSREGMRLLTRFLDEKKDAPLVERDATGTAIAYIQRHSAVYAMPISGRFDVGDVATYIECCDYFDKRKQ